MAKKFKKRTGPAGVKQSAVSKIKYYKSPFNPFPINPSTGGNCTWYAWGRFAEIWAECGGTPAASPPSTGNAVSFYSRAKANKRYKVGLEPKPGAIICWGYGSAGGNPGHVAVVESVTKSGDKVTSIEVSNSGWSSGPMANKTLTRGDGKAGYSAWNFHYGNCYFNGFVYNPMESDSSGTVDAGGDYVDMKERISKLYSSDNFKYMIDQDAAVENAPLTAIDKFKMNLVSSIKNLSKNTSGTTNKTVVSDDSIKNAIDIFNGKTKKSIKKELVVNNTFSISKYLVEAPFVEINMGGYIIGSYKGSLDQFPNYISSLEVSKVNGEINKYKIQIIYQIRYEEDPNLIDKLISTVRYKKFKIQYGDAASDTLFRDNNAIITNITSNRDYTGAKITYNIEATSANVFVTSYITNFSSVTDKPSNIIRNLLYNNAETSPLLLEAFSGMKNVSLVDSKGLIPNNDSVLDIQSQTSMNPVSYINYLVGNMSNSTQTSNTIRNSNYYINYLDDSEGTFGGSYFKISELTQASVMQSNINSVFEVTVGYPDSNNIMDFAVNTDNCWAMLYKNSEISNERIYNIDNYGNTSSLKSLNVVSSSNILNEINKNWWSQMINFPITAQLTLRGLLKPVMLTDYIKINVVFYGQTHITSGLYTITGQTDKLSSSGFRTILDLTRVGN